MSEHSKIPWRVFTNPDGTKLIGIGKETGEGILDCGFGVWSWNHPDGIANANLVVTAVNAHDALVKALEDLLNAARNEAIDSLVMRQAREALASIKDRA